TDGRAQCGQKLTVCSALPGWMRTIAALLLDENVEHLARFDRFYGLAQGRGQPFVIFTSVSSGVHDNDAEGQFFEIMLEFKATVQRDQDIEASLRQLDKLIVEGALPLRFADRGDLVSGHEVTDTRVDAFVYEETHSARSCSFASSRN